MISRILKNCILGPGLNSGSITTENTLFLSIFLTLSGFIGPLSAAAMLPARQSRSVESFNISAEPTKTDWQYFLDADPHFRSSLWQYQNQRGKDLKDWSWQWRLGWVRACTDSNEHYCAKIFTAALSDKAVVVRADAATRLGRRFEGTGNTWATNALVQAYQNPKNSRHGSPLYVQQRILFSLKQIGGSKANAAGGRIARAHPGSAAYWEKIHRG